MDGALGSRGAALFDVYSDDNTTNGLQQVKKAKKDDFLQKTLILPSLLFHVFSSWNKK